MLLGEGRVVSYEQKRLLKHNVKRGFNSTISKYYYIAAISYFACGEVDFRKGNSVHLCRYETADEVTKSFDSTVAKLVRIGFVMEFLQQKNTAQRILNSLVGRRSSRRNTHNNLFADVFQELLGNNLSRNRSMGNGIVGSNALSAVNVKGTNASLRWDFQQVSGIGRVPASNDQDKIQVLLVSDVNKFNNSVLSLLCQEGENKQDSDT